MKKRGICNGYHTNDGILPTYYCNPEKGNPWRFMRHTVGDEYTPEIREAFYKELAESLDIVWLDGERLDLDRSKCTVKPFSNGMTITKVGRKGTTSFNDMIIIYRDNTYVRYTHEYNSLLYVDSAPAR